MQKQQTHLCFTTLCTRTMFLCQSYSLTALTTHEDLSCFFSGVGGRQHYSAPGRLPKKRCPSPPVLIFFFLSCIGRTGNCVGSFFVWEKCTHSPIAVSCWEWRLGGWGSCVMWREDLGSLWWNSFTKDSLKKLLHAAADMEPWLWSIQEQIKGSDWSWIIILALWYLEAPPWPVINIPLKKYECLESVLRLLVCSCSLFSFSPAPFQQYWQIWFPVVFDAAAYFPFQKDTDLLIYKPYSEVH